MNKTLNKIWRKLGCVVHNKLGPNRSVRNACGRIVISGGYQKELSYLMIHHPKLLREINV